MLIQIKWIGSLITLMEKELCLICSTVVWRKEEIWGTASTKNVFEDFLGIEHENHPNLTNTDCKLVIVFEQVIA